MNIEKLVYNVDYEGLLDASVDWIAGGNFDGYVVKTILRFHSNGKVVRVFKILDKSRYDGNVEGFESIGTFHETNNDTFTCIFENYSMRGKILGDRNQYLAFSLSGHRPTECYELRM